MGVCLSRITAFSPHVAPLPVSCEEFPAPDPPRLAPRHASGEIEFTDVRTVDLTDRLAPPFRQPMLAAVLVGVAPGIQNSRR